MATAQMGRNEPLGLPLDFHTHTLLFRLEQSKVIDILSVPYRQWFQKRREGFMACKAVRVQLDFSEKAFDRVEMLRKKTGAKDTASVVQKALCLYEWFILKKEEEGEGGESIKQIH